MAKLTVYGAGGVARNVKKLTVFGAGGVARNVSKAWVYGLDGTPRLFFNAIPPSGFSMLTGNTTSGGAGRGFEKGVGGVLTPTPGFGPKGMECTHLFTFNSVNLFRLVLASPSDPGQSAFTSMSIPGFGATWNPASASAYNWNGTYPGAAMWQWNTASKFALGVTATVSFNPP